MRLPFSPAGDDALVTRHGPAWIAAGLAGLIAAAVWPSVPVVTAMGLVALGATGVLVDRFRAAASFVPLAAVQLATYAGLYALFLGATLDAAARSANGLSGWQCVDLAASAVPMAAAVGVTLRAVRQAGAT